VRSGLGVRFAIVSVWPAFVSRVMYNDEPVRLVVGDQVCWDAMLIDGAAEGWPSHVLVDTRVEIDDPPPGALHGAVARTPEFCVCWRGSSPVGARFQISAGLVADWFNPPFRCTVTGQITRKHTVWVPADRPAGGGPGVSMCVVETGEDVVLLHRPSMPDQAIAGLLVELDVWSSEIAAFTSC
jgi:hypothetical protein